MTIQTCPAPERLREFARGEFDSDDLDQHLDSCPDCRRTVDTLANGPTSLLRCLRPLPAGDAVADPALRPLAARAKAFAWQTPSAPVAPPLAAGQILGDYEVQGTIARGGMGWVLRAWHRRMKRPVALKTLSPALHDQGEAAARFQREVETLARLSHPHIVAAHDAFEHQGQRFLVMEYVAGCGLDQWVREHGPLSVEQAVAFLTQAARGLAHAHAAGIIHRDVKPANLLLDESNTIKVLDLGLARPTRSDAATSVQDLTGGSVVMGTAAYMAPEQALDPRSADARADVYGLGCTLHFLLTGRPPYQGESPLAILLAHRDEPIPSLRAARPDCPASLDALFRRMLAKRPEDRPGSMQEVLGELQRGSNHRPTRRRTIVAAALLAASLLLGLILLPALKPAQPKAAPAPVDKGEVKTPQIEMVRVEAGNFFMGAGDNEREAQPDEKPRHKVRITRAFLLGKFEVTQEQYQEVMGVNPSAFQGKGKSRDQVKDLDTRQHPVESVSWMDAIAFCNRLSEKHGLEPYYRVEKNTVTVRGGNGYRLPTEAEWEYAARAGSDARWSFGNDERDLDAHVWFAGNAADRTHAVGTKKANAWGLHDMHGNVPEWCWDRYDPQYYDRSPASDPPGSGSGRERVYRGGGWNNLAAQTRSAARNMLGTAYSVTTPVGLRVARDP
jgi:serine/threonine protein kinase